jgi:hypothetical protein
VKRSIIKKKNRFKVKKVKGFPMITSNLPGKQMVCNTSNISQAYASGQNIKPVSSLCTGPYKIAYEVRRPDKMEIPSSF